MPELEQCRVRKVCLLLEPVQGFTALSQYSVQSGFDHSLAMHDFGISCGSDDTMLPGRNALFLIWPTIYSLVEITIDYIALM